MVWPELVTVRRDGFSNWFSAIEHSGFLDVVWTLGAAMLAAVGALAVHLAVMSAARRLARRTRTDQDDALVDFICQPLRWIMVAAALLLLGRLPVPSADTAATVAGLTRAVFPLLAGWLLIATIRFLKGYVYAKSDIAAEDNLAARRRRTRADILARIAIAIVLLVSAGLMLLNIPEVREIGLALVASAGIAGLAFGVAAQPLLKNLVAGFQLAFTEPVRIDDVVVYRGEWGRVESISLTYVVLKIWDDRRLVIPVSKLVEEPIENWTRQTSHLLGTVMIYVDHAADVERLRDIASQTVRMHHLWDGRTAKLQVTDMTPETLELRVLMSARNGSELFELRCDVREQVARALASEIPESLNRIRVELQPLESE
jgi:small-conductance mechanosensitive channel